MKVIYTDGDWLIIQRKKKGNWNKNLSLTYDWIKSGNNYSQNILFDLKSNIVSPSKDQDERAHNVYAQDLERKRSCKEQILPFHTGGIVGNSSTQKNLKQKSVASSSNEEAKTHPSKSNMVKNKVAPSPPPKIKKIIQSTL